MVFLTFMNFARNLNRPDKFWRKEMYKRMSWHMYGRKRTCFPLGIRYVRRALRYSTQSRQLKKDNLKQLWTERVEAGCGEHNIDLRSFRAALAESEVALNAKMLSDLSIYEPRTFAGLVQFAKKRNEAVETSADSSYPSVELFPSETR